MKPWAVVPVKSFASAKTRLDHLTAQARADLAQTLFEHVIEILNVSCQLGGILVATNSDRVAALAGQRGCDIICDPSVPRAVHKDAGELAHIVDASLTHLAARRVGAALVIMADLPTLETGDIAAVVAAMSGNDVVIAPDRRDMGTNALGLTPPLILPTCFGHQDSFWRHRDTARRRALRAQIHRSPGLGFDIDLPEDHRALTSLKR